MEEMRGDEGVNTWIEELASLVEDSGIRYNGDTIDMTAAPPPPPMFAATGLVESETEMKSERESLKEQVTGFLKSWGEMAVDLGKGCKDIVTQSNLVTEDSFIVQKFGKPMAKASARLKFLNEFLPEDRDPVVAWSVIFSVFVLALAAISINSTDDSLVPLVKKTRVHPPSADRILLPDGRHLAYLEQGVPADRARFSVIAPHSFLSSRLAGIPGVKTSLLHEFGVRLVTYDLPGFGESDPHIIRNLNSSAMDMLYLADAVGVNGKFWVLSYSSGSMHSWAALRYIPDRIAGAGMFAPMINPYEPSMTKEEMRRTWNQWSSRKKLLYFLARKFPKFLAYFYHRSFLSGNHGQIDKWMSQSLGMKDEILIKEPMFEEFWHRDVEESIRQGSTKSFIEEAVLQVSNWGFSIADLQVQRKCQGNGFLLWLRSMISHVECELVGFLGPIHIWQGMDDQVVPPSMIDYISRVLPGANLHTLPNEGHFSYYFFCDECHRQIFSTLFGDALGPLDQTILTSVEAEVEEVPSTTNSAGK
ncbi:HYDROLASE ALPHA/BETA FOLD FAMILY PROTEIN EXPRESSED-RELATED [Salix koriyanagi]|uniref:HYDROLASE ALPHA/BETA FOLD FAMILY PROTEIN EXPRESSED-RELATED n=1 Tax=Salix koriyanagi TaxID=2511006 RepID=A0A9Q0VE77_9ROSI|nr:HYDROLASE ALPHA/BETA FOLD FAMILY PROTEIN EXPRESSED-RELATED [Salix koriyanagi]